MTATKHCLASLARLSLSNALRPSATQIPQFLAPAIAHGRLASGKSLAKKGGVSAKGKGGSDTGKSERKKRAHKSYRLSNKQVLEQYSLCDAVRYLRAFEVGHPPSSVKYDLAVRIRGNKSTQVIRSSIKLPHPVKTDIRVGVICKEGSAIARQAKKLGAVAAGEQTLFDAIRANAGALPFNRLVCHADSAQALSKAGLGRILGPKGLMPSTKLKTISSDIQGLIEGMAASDNFREREGTIRMAIGQLEFTPKMLGDNVKALLAQIKEGVVELQENEVDKSVHEVVLSSTNGPGFSLNGTFNPTDEGLQEKHLEGAM